MDSNIEKRLKALEMKSGPSSGFALTEAYITFISEDGTRILVSPLTNDSAVFEATALSPLPTSLIDGRRLQGVPTAKNGADGATDCSTCVCAVINGKYFILGYYNLEDGDTGEKMSYVKDTDESYKPFRGGMLLKISKTASIIIRKANWIITYMSPWSTIDAKGVVPGDGKREAVHSTTWTNIKQRTWGGFNRWMRVKEDNTALESPTLHTNMQGKFHEPDILTDVDLGQQERNDSIDETSSAPGSDVPAKNKDKLGYIDKVIKRSGSIDDDTHVYEREVRQSKEVDAEKTVFTRLREGHRDGVLSEYETIDTLLFTNTTEKRGRFDDGRLMYDSYTQYVDADNVLKDNMITQFGNNGVDVYSKVINIDDGSSPVKQVSLTVLTDGTINIATANDEAKFILDAKLIESGRVAADDVGLTEVVRWDALQVQLTAIVDLIKNHDHNTGVGPSTAASAGVLSPALFTTYASELASTHEINTKSVTSKVN